MHGNSRVLVIVILCAVIAGCGAGPSVEQLRQDLQRQLDEEFKADMFTVETFRRMGTHKEAERLLVYFDATIAFAQDYSMADWNTLGLEALVTVLGAGARGVDGIRPEGNKAGDQLNVHGTLLYLKGPQGWVRRVGEVSQALTADDPRGSVLENQFDSVKAMLADIEDMGRDAVLRKDAPFVEQIHSFVRVTRNRLAKRSSSPQRKELIIATGHIAGTYYPLGRALAEVLGSAGMPTRVQQTEGSAENCKMLHHEYVDLAVCQNDVAFEAHNGTGLFEDGALSGVTALCSWFPEPVQIFVLASGPIKTIEELKGQVISVGPRASGTNVNAFQVLRAYGFTDADLMQVKESPAAAGFDLLRQKTAAAVFLTEAAPARVLRRAMAEERIRLLTIRPTVVSRLVKEHPFFVPLVIPARTYPGQDEDVATVAVTAMLVANPALSNEVVHRILAAQYDNLGTFMKAHPKGAVISVRHALDGLSIPQHPGAIRFFADQRSK